MEKHVRLPLAVAGGVVVLYAMAVLGFVATSPDIGLRCLIFEELPDGNLEQGIPIRSIDGMVCKGELPKPGDILVRIGDNRIRTFLDFTRQFNGLRNATIPPGGQLYPNADPSELSASLPSIVEYPDGQRWVELEFIRLEPDGTARKHSGSFLLIQSLPLTQVLLTFVWFLLQLGILAFAALAFWHRPFDRSSRLFFGMCIVTLGAFVGGFHWWVVAAGFWLNLPFVICAVLVPAVVLHFFLVFPRPKVPLAGTPFLTLAGIYLVPSLVIVLFLSLLMYADRLQAGEVSDAGVEGVLSSLQTLWWGIYSYLAVAAVYFVLAMLSLKQSYRTARSPMERRQLLWIWRAGQVASVFIGITLFLALFRRVDFALGASRLPMFLASLSFMLAYSVGILRYRLMLVDQIVSKGMRYYVLTAGLTVAFSLAVGMSTLLPRFLNISPYPQQALTVMAVVVLGVMLALWLRDRFQQAIDQQFFREKYQLDKALQRMNLAMSQIAAPEKLAEMMLGSCRDVLHVEQAALYLRTSPNGPFQLIAADGTEEVPLQYQPDDEFLETLSQERSLQRVTPGSRSEMSAIQNALRELKADLLYALEVDQNIAGLVTLGKKGNSSPFSAEDLTFLNALSQITNVAFHSAKVDRDIARLNEELQLKLEKITGQQRQIAFLQSELAATQIQQDESPAKRMHGSEFRREPIKGNSSAMQNVLQTARKVAESESSVLIRGESGTGKEILAQVLHNNSPRRSGSMVRVHCAALSPGLLESELFGHVKGAFTGAHRDKIGRFEMANGGTLFLDEIGDISLETQIKLLRVLQERCFEPVGGTRTVHVDVRLITATHQNLEKLIAAGRFREDLYYRLNVISVTVPPLRDRKEDILELALTFLNRSAGRMGTRVSHFSDEALSALEQYDWPGNVRELENAIERAVVLAEGESIAIEDLPEEILQPVSTPASGKVASVSTALKTGESNGDSRRNDGLTEKDSEREMLEKALEECRGNKAQAARLLGLPRSTYYSKLKKYGIA